MARYENELNKKLETMKSELLGKINERRDTEKVYESMRVVEERQKLMEIKMEEQSRNN